ncbi:MAG: helix-turn-helix domain-containing protein [Tissierellia bacterium]|nr:helix-turn-helix transcriptional regulator [Bacillota bacterium]NLL23083.1 helix-turn-helix domain-containing protein [Tissierellia bacterium]
MDRKEIFRKRLAALLADSGMTQTELAEKLGRTQSLIGSYLAGRREPSLTVLIEMANIFQVDIDYLVGRDAPDTIATHSEFDELTEAEKLDLIKFKEFLISKR